MNAETHRPGRPTLPSPPRRDPGILRVAWAAALLAASGASLAQSAACSQLRATLAARIDPSIRGFTLETLPAGNPVPAGTKVIGTCDGGAFKILYRRGGHTRPQEDAQAPAPAKAASAARPEAPAPAPAPAPALAPKPEERPRPPADAARAASGPAAATDLAASQSDKAAPRAIPAASAARSASATGTGASAPETRPHAPTQTLPPQVVSQAFANGVRSTAGASASAVVSRTEAERVARQASANAEDSWPLPVQNTAPEVDEPFVQQAAEFATRHWPWLAALFGLPLALALWAGYIRHRNYDSAGLPRGPRL